MSTLDHGADRDELFELGLRALREEEGTSEQARALEQRLLDSLGAKSFAATLTPATASLGRTWLLLGVSVLIGAGALIGRPHQAPLTQGAEPPAPQREVAISSQAALLQESAPALANNLIAPAQVHATVESTVAPRQRAQRRRARRVLGSQVAPAANAPPLEAELPLLLRARTALRRDPAAALQLVEQHARDYAAGVFTQEREVLAIQALLKQGRHAAAIERAERFVAQQPGSPYALRMFEMLADKPRGIGESRAPAAPPAEP